MTPIACPVCGLRIDLTAGEVARGLVPDHFRRSGRGGVCRGAGLRLLSSDAVAGMARATR